MNSWVHLPVMPDEVVRLLFTNSGTRFLDATLGSGGHAAKLLEVSDKPIEIIGIDVDPEAVERAKARFAQNSNVHVHHGDYGNLKALRKTFGLEELDGILADFGQSSDQMESAGRGMSHRHLSDLDMRFDQTRGATAEEILNSIELTDLKRALKEIGQEPDAGRVAKAIIVARPLRTTHDLERAIRSATRSHEVNKTLARCFMVIRTIVNDELGAIDCFLQDAPDLLKSTGILVCISFDSNMDRRVKSAFRSLVFPCSCPPQLAVCVCGRKPTFKYLTHKALRPSPLEERANPRSRSARLRAVEKI